jgi:glycine hydroxymethyltransferase
MEIPPMIIKDFEIRELTTLELQRQQQSLQMIPSENYTSEEVLKACGSILSNKYAEGYPGKRYYQGNDVIDKIELLAITRAKRLFNAEHVNVQPHSGAPANLAVYNALLQPKDKIMALRLDHGGHLTHGSPVNVSGKFYDFCHYAVDKETGMLDYDAIAKLARQENPKLILSGFTAYPRKIDFKFFHELATEIGAYSMADISHIAGLIAGDTHQSPLPFTDIVTTTTHKTLRGPRSAIIMSKVEDRFREKFHPESKKNMAQMIDSAVFPGMQGGPHQHTIAAKAVAFKEALQPEFKDYAQQVVKNAKILAETLMQHGIKLVSEGTDNHLILIDLINTSTIGKEGMGKKIALSLEKAGIITNANTVPFDPSTPFKPSGIRLGTPALTTRGMKDSEMTEIGECISQVLKNPYSDTNLARVKWKVEELCENHPIYQDKYGYNEGN